MAARSSSMPQFCSIAPVMGFEDSICTCLALSLLGFLAPMFEGLASHFSDPSLQGLLNMLSSHGSKEHLQFPQKSFLIMLMRVLVPDCGRPLGHHMHLPTHMFM